MLCLRCCVCVSVRVSWRYSDAALSIALFIQYYLFFLFLLFFLPSLLFHFLPLSSPVPPSYSHFSIFPISFFFLNYFSSLSLSSLLLFFLHAPLFLLAQPLSPLIYPSLSPPSVSFPFRNTSVLLFFFFFSISLLPFSFSFLLFFLLFPRLPLSYI